MSHHNRWHFTIEIFSNCVSLIAQLQGNLINGLISFLFYECKTGFTMNTCFPLTDVDDLEIADFSYKALSITNWAILDKLCL